MKIIMVSAGGAGHRLTVRVTEANSRITEYTRPLLLIVTYEPETRKQFEHSIKKVTFSFKMLLNT